MLMYNKKIYILFKILCYIFYIRQHLSIYIGLLFIGVSKITEPNRLKPNRNRFEPNQSLFQTIRLKISLIQMVWFGSVLNRTEPKDRCVFVII